MEVNGNGNGNGQVEIEEEGRCIGIGERWMVLARSTPRTIKDISTIWS
jgi:hypothetical protein